MGFLDQLVGKRGEEVCVVRVCVCAGRRSAEGFEGALEKWRSGGAVERCGGAVKDFSKKKKEIRGLVLGESGNGL